MTLVGKWVKEASEEESLHHVSREFTRDMEFARKAKRTITRRMDQVHEKGDPYEIEKYMKQHAERHSDDLETIVSGNYETAPTVKRGKLERDKIQLHNNNTAIH